MSKGTYGFYLSFLSIGGIGSYTLPTLTYGPKPKTPVGLSRQVKINLRSRFCACSDHLFPQSKSLQIV